MNGLVNGMYDGLTNGLNNGLFDGLDNGLHNGLVNNEIVNDADAQNFIAAIGSLNQLQQYAIKKLVFDLKANALWNKMKALYPFIGGSASTHKFNLKNPLNTDAAFRLVFSGGWTHSSTGATPNGTNAYADTFLTASTHLSKSSAHFAKYNRNNDLVGTQKCDGSYSGSGASITYFQHNYVSANAVIGEVGLVVSYTPTNTKGLYIASRTELNNFSLFRNNISLGNNTSTISNISSVKNYIGARLTQPGTADSFNSYECAFASLGDGLTDNQIKIYYNIVQNYQTLLGRQV